MNVMRILHIGDIHFPDNKYIVDHKDPSMPDQLVKAVSPNILQEVFRKVLDIVFGDNKINVVMFSGDLTTGGNIIEYQKCVDYLCTALKLNDVSFWQPENIHVVPGNHDVDRESCDDLDLSKKFQPLRNAWSKQGLQVIATDSIRSTSVKAGNCNLKIFSLNSCWGCGEKRYLPNAVQEKFKEILELVAKENQGNKGNLELIWEQLDTPAFVQDHISELISELNKLDKNTLPIVMCHHNILPQAVPRIAVYTELINAGIVRTRLVNVKHPVLLCHGHIHENVVEIVRHTSSEFGPLLITSAPDVAKGFNLIEVVFTDDGFPMGCKIIPYLRSSDGEVRLASNKIEPIPLHSVSAYLAIAKEPIVELIRKLKPDYIRFHEVYEKFKKIQGAQEFNEVQFSELLEEAEWFGLVKIASREEQFKHWQVMRQLP